MFWDKIKKITPLKEDSLTVVSCKTKFREYLEKYARGKNLRITELCAQDNSYHCCLSRDKDTGEPFKSILAMSYQGPDTALAMALLTLNDPTCDFLD